MTESQAAAYGAAVNETPDDEDDDFPNKEAVHDRGQTTAIADDRAQAEHVHDEKAEYAEIIKPEDGTNHNWSLNEATQHILKESGLENKLDSFEGILGYDTAIERKNAMDKMVNAYRKEAENCDDATRQETAVEVSQLILGDMTRQMTLEEARDAFGYSPRLYHALKMAGVTHNDILYAADGGIYANFEISEENATMEKLRDICEVTGFDVTQVVQKHALHDKIIADFADTLFNAENRSDEDVDGRLLIILKEALENRNEILGDEEERMKAAADKKMSGDNTDNPGLQFEVNDAALAYRRNEAVKIDQKVTAYVDQIAESIEEEDEDFKPLMNGVTFLSDYHQSMMLKGIAEPATALKANEDFVKQMEALHEAIIANNGYAVAEGLETAQLKEPITTLDQLYEFGDGVAPAYQALKEAAEDPKDPESQALNDAVKTIVAQAITYMNQASAPIEKRAEAGLPLDNMETQLQWEEVNAQARIIAEYTKPGNKEGEKSLTEAVGEVVGGIAKEGAKQAVYGAAAAALVP